MPGRPGFVDKPEQQDGQELALERRGGNRPQALQQDCIAAFSTAWITHAAGNGPTAAAQAGIAPARHPACRFPACRFPQMAGGLRGWRTGRAQYTAFPLGNRKKQDMEPDDSSDTLANRLAQLELLVQIQKEEIRRISLERDLLAAWYDATKAIPAQPMPARVVEEACPS